MNFDYSKLIARIYEIFKTQLAFAIQMGWTQRKCALKLNNSAQWFQYEIDKACKLLQIDDSEINSYFFKRSEGGEKSENRKAVCHYRRSNGDNRPVPSHIT